MKHAGSFESTEEAKVALGDASSNSYASFLLFKFPRGSYVNELTLKHEPIVNYKMPKYARDLIKFWQTADWMVTSFVI